jgi:hypothetical protein
MSTAAGDAGGELRLKQTKCEGMLSKQASRN